MDNDNPLIELCCKHEEVDWPCFQGESFGQNLYIIKCIYWDMVSPINPLDISLNDVVEANRNEDDNLCATQITTKSGCTTLYFIATSQSICVHGDYQGEDAVRFIDYLEKNACYWIVSWASYWLVHTPPDFDFQKILIYIQTAAIPLQHYQFNN